MTRTLLFSTMTLGLVLMSPAAMAGKKDKKKGKDKGPPPTGWVQKQETWAGSCYFPPDWESMGVGDRKLARSSTMDELMAQWTGQRDDGVSFPEKHTTNIETVMFAKSERVELIATENLEKCRMFMNGKISLSDWEAWLIATPGKLTVGECPYAPLDYTLFDYLDIFNGWQIPANVCKDDHIKVHGTENDYFKYKKDSEWINVGGDTNAPTATGFECNVEGCFEGQLIMKFTGDSGITKIIPVGIETTFLVPEHGEIKVMINDNDLSDNVWKVDSGLEHHTGIEYSPVEKK